MTFSGGERHVQLLKEDDFVSPPSFVMRALLHSNDDIFDLLLLRNALSKRFPGAPVDVEIPYMPYGRQDRVAAPGQAFSLNVMSDILKTADFRHMTTWDCHSWRTLALTKARNIEPQEIIRRCPELVALIEGEESVLVSPDAGAALRTRAVSDAFGCKRFVRCEKHRNPSTGQITHTSIEECDLTGKTAIIVDDICDGGFTFLEVAKLLKGRGAERVILYVTHGIFSRGLKVFTGLVDRVFASTSFWPLDPAVTSIDFKYDFKGELPL